MIKCHFVTLGLYKNLKWSKLCSFIISGFVWSDWLTKTKSRSRRIAFQIFKMVPILKRFQRFPPIENSTEISRRKLRLQNFVTIYPSVRSISWLHTHSQMNLLFLLALSKIIYLSLRSLIQQYCEESASFEESARL